MNVRQWNIGNRRITRFCTDPGAPALYVHASLEEAQQMAQNGWTVIVLDGIDWNHDLSPWKAKAVFRGQPDFGGGAEAYLCELTQQIIPAVEADIQPCARSILGYSLAGLFAVYAAAETGMFESAASVSGSMWFPGFVQYAENAPHVPGFAYFSVGDREKRSRSAVFQTIEDSTLAVIGAMRERGADTMFEYNPGTHFDDPAGRMMKAMKRLDDKMKNTASEG